MFSRFFNLRARAFRALSSTLGVRAGLDLASGMLVTRTRRPVTIYEQLVAVCSGVGDRLLGTTEIKQLLAERFGTNPASIIPSDFCYNRRNQGVQNPKPLFVRLGTGEYRYLGPGDPFTGPVFARPRGAAEDEIVGEWVAGTLRLYGSEGHGALRAADDAERPEDSAISADPVEGVVIFREGAARQVYSTTYERHAQARAQCIAAYGTRCAVCTFDFGRMYGELGRGFIHVHHLCQLSDFGAEHEVNPITDLRPVCPNCHAMIHRRNPPYSIKEVQGMLASASHSHPSPTSG